LAKIISVVNQKGGVGKTTSVINVGASLAILGKRVLLLDMDPQGNLSSGLGVETEESGKNAYFALIGESKLSENIVKTHVDRLYVCPSDSNLAGAEVELVDYPEREFCLKKSVDDYIHENFDYVLIDCPPSLGLLTINSLCASNSYLIPMQAEFFALQGFTQLVQTTNTIKKVLNPKLGEEGILITMYDSRSNFAKQVHQDIRVFARDRVFTTVVPRRIRLAESTSHGNPGVIYDSTCYGARSYLKVAEELLNREQGLIGKEKTQSFVPPDPVDRLGKVRSTI